MFMYSIPDPPLATPLVKGARGCGLNSNSIVNRGIISLPFPIIPIHVAVVRFELCSIN